MKNIFGSGNIRCVSVAAILSLLLCPAALWGQQGKPPLPVLGFRAQGFAAPSFGKDQAALGAWGWSAGLGAQWNPIDSLEVRAETGFFSVGDSAWDPSLFRYRSFYSWRTAILGGIGLPIGSLELQALAGFSVHIARYSGLSVASAFPGLEASIGLSIPFAVGDGAWMAVFELPASFLFRGTARTWSLGIQAGASLNLGQGRKR
ncbi:MAG TPA: hypothetical protein VIO60_07370 [Rectinemataceae bacterium]